MLAYHEVISSVELADGKIDHTRRGVEVQLYSFSV